MTERGNHEELILAPKVGFDYGEVPQPLDPELIDQEVERSLDRLDTKYVDLLYAHVDEVDLPIFVTIDR